MLKETGKIDNLNNFINEINKREEILSTYCGHGVAIPHCESTEVLESGFAFGRSNGLIWDKNDDSVFFIILLAISKIEKTYEGKMYSDFKADLGDIIVDLLEPIQNEYQLLMKDKSHIENILKNGAEKAWKKAYKTLDKVYRKMGLVKKL